MNFKSYTIQEVKQLKKKLTDKSYKLQNDLSEVDIKIKRIDNLIAAAKNKDQSAEIIIPQEIFQSETHHEIAFGAIKWKSCILRIIKASNKFLSCNIIYDKLLIEHSMELRDKRVAMKSISSALVNLVSEGKVGKFKDEKGLFHFGDILKHFEKNGRPNMAFHKNSNSQSSVAK